MTKSPTPPLTTQATASETTVSTSEASSGSQEPSGDQPSEVAASSSSGEGAQRARAPKISRTPIVWEHGGAGGAPGEPRPRGGGASGGTARRSRGMRRGSGSTRGAPST